MLPPLAEDPAALRWVWESLWSERQTEARGDKFEDAAWTTHEAVALAAYVTTSAFKIHDRTQHKRAIG